jgi:hypothetical protein
MITDLTSGIGNPGSCNDTHCLGYALVSLPAMVLIASLDA